MLKLNFLHVMALVVLLMAVALAENNFLHHVGRGVAGVKPFISFTAPQARSQSVVRDLEIIQDNNDPTLFNDNLNDDDEEREEDYDEEYGNVNNEEMDSDAENDESQNEAETEADDPVYDKNSKLKFRESGNQHHSNAKLAKIVASLQPRNGIIMPYGVIEIEAQTVVDESTGQSALLLPRSILNVMPSGSAVALLESNQILEAEGRAQRVVVRQHRKGANSYWNRLPGGNNRYRGVKPHGNRDGSNFRRRHVIIVPRLNGRNGNKRRVNQRPIYILD